MKFSYTLTLLTTILLGCTNTPTYQNPDQPVEKRVQQLLQLMTIEEKAAQLDMLDASSILSDSGELDYTKLKKWMHYNTVGAVHDLYPISANVSNEIQRFVKENSKLAIPPLLIEEALHGYQGKGSTTFPIPLANASSWDTTLLFNIGKVIATEARAHGVHLVLGPNLDLAREPRWGRVEETFGEDAYLSARLCVNIIKGLQGTNLKNHDAVVAEPKHFGIHGIPENGSNLSPVYIGERDARSTHLYVFEKAVKEAKAHAVMAAYHEIDGVPVAGNKWLLTNVLRKEWGFQGFVISDLGAIAMQFNKHRTAATPEDAIITSINAGLNMQFYDFPHDTFVKTIVDGVKNGKISQQTLDRAVGEILTVKFKLGLFDNPYIDTTIVKKVHHSAEHQQLAKQAALESLVLLKNDNKTLPFKKNVKKIVVAGQLAGTSSLGGYSPQGAKGVTIIEALKKRFGNTTQILWLNAHISPYFTDIPASALTRLNGNENGVDVEYFNNLELAGKPAYTTVENGISHYWHNLSPAPGVNNEPFSARLKCKLHVETSGLYEFSLIANNYGRLYIDGKLVLDNWNDQLTEVTTTAKIYLEKEKPVNIVSEYGKVSDFAGQRIKWRFAGGKALDNINQLITQQAADADAIIVVIGESTDEVGEAKDKQNLNLHEIDVNMVNAAAKAGKPVATVLVNGRPLILNEINDISDAILEAWFPGEAGGDAIVDALFGDYNPSGHLTISFPQSMGQLPVYYAKKSSAARTSIDGATEPLYHFGHGLSYTTFEYENIHVEPAQPTVNQNVIVTFDVHNTGTVDGTEVAQLYVKDVVSSTTTPEIALKGFARVDLKANETKKITITLTPEHLSLINIDMERVTEPGEFDILVGRASNDIRLKTTITLK